MYDQLNRSSISCGATHGYPAHRQGFEGLCSAVIVLVTGYLYYIDHRNSEQLGAVNNLEDFNPQTTLIRSQVIHRMVCASLPELLDQESLDTFPKELIPHKKKIIDWLEKGRVYRSLRVAAIPSLFQAG